MFTIFIIILTLAFLFWLFTPDYDEFDDLMSRLDNAEDEDDPKTDCC